MDALSRSDSGVLIEKDYSLYCALPSLDLQVINSWIQLQKPVFPNLKICGIYSSEEINILDYEFLVLDKLYYIVIDTVYSVKWLDQKVKELGYYTVKDSKLKLRTITKEFVSQDFDLENLKLSQIIGDLSNLDLTNMKTVRFLLNNLSKVHLNHGQLKEIKGLVQNVISQIRIQGSKGF